MASWQLKDQEGKATLGSPIFVRIKQEEHLGIETNHATLGSSTGKESLNTFGCKNVWGLWWQEKLPDSQRVHWRDPQGPRIYTKSPTQELGLEGPNLLQRSG